MFLIAEKYIFNSVLLCEGKHMFTHIRQPHSSTEEPPGL